MTEVETAAPESVEVAPQKLEDLPKDLQAHVHTIRALTVAHNLIAEGSYPCMKFQQVQESIVFLRSIRERSIELASVIDGADSVPELKQFKDLQAAQAEAKKSEANAQG